MDLLCFCSVLCLLCLCARLFIYALWSPAVKGLTSWLLFVVSDCEVCHFPIGILGQVWYLIYRFQIFAPLGKYRRFNNIRITDPIPTLREMSRNGSVTMSIAI